MGQQASASDEQERELENLRRKMKDLQVEAHEGRGLRAALKKKDGEVRGEGYCVYEEGEGEREESAKRCVGGGRGGGRKRYIAWGGVKGGEEEVWWGGRGVWGGGRGVGGWKRCVGRRKRFVRMERESAERGGGGGGREEVCGGRGGRRGGGGGGGGRKRYVLYVGGEAGVLWGERRVSCGGRGRCLVGGEAGVLWGERQVSCGGRGRCLVFPPVTLWAVAGGGTKRCPSGAGARARRSQEGHG